MGASRPTYDMSSHRHLFRRMSASSRSVGSPALRSVAVPARLTMRQVRSSENVYQRYSSISTVSARSFFGTP